MDATLKNVETKMSQMMMNEESERYYKIRQESRLNWDAEMMYRYEKGVEDGQEIGYNKGVEDGQKQRDRELIKRMLAQGYTADSISNALGIPIAQVQAVKKNFRLKPKVN